MTTLGSTRSAAVAGPCCRWLFSVPMMHMANTSLFLNITLDYFDVFQTFMLNSHLWGPSVQVLRLFLKWFALSF